MKCRSCGPECSSQWAQEFIDTKGKEKWDQYFPDRKVIINNNDDQKFMIKLKPYLADVTEVYFAGGEPLLMPEHWQTLDLLVENKRFDVMIDDGPHTLESMLKFIRLYSKLMTDNGILIIEDIYPIIKNKDDRGHGDYLEEEFLEAIEPFEQYYSNIIFVNSQHKYKYTGMYGEVRMLVLYKK
jgi:hypothetical protein